MNRKALKTCVGILASALGILLGTPGARAQSAPPPIPGDWGSLGAYVNRQNRNGDPQTYNPGKNDLRWTTPNTTADRAVLTLDNTDFAALFFSNATTADQRNASIDDPLYNAGQVSLIQGSNAPYVWRGPDGVGNEAGSPYTLAKRNRYGALTPTQPTGPKPVNYTPDASTRVPSYLFTECTPSAQGQSDPTVAQDSSDLRYFEWTFTPPAGPDRNYAIYANLPIGPTTATTGNAGTQRLFPQRYYVYKIFYGNPTQGLSYTDVVDTYAAGNGFVRLGGGGLSTTRLFPFLNANSTDSTAAYPIRVRIYNTVPRASDGTLLIDGAAPSMSIQAERTLARSRLVYADAARLTPQIGAYAASPVTQTFVAGPTAVPDGPAGIDARVTVALNEYQTGTVDGALQQSTAGTVISYQSNPDRWVDPLVPLEKWRYSLAQESSNAVNVDNPSPTEAAGGWAAGTTTAHVGANYLTRAIVVDTPGTPPTPPGAIATATYAPALDTGDYTLYAYIGGGTAYGTSVRFNIYQGGTLVDTALVNEAVPQNSRRSSGWVRIGLRRYRNVRDDNDLTNAAPLAVVVTNYSSVQADAGKLAYADAIRFVGDQDSAITSTPIHTAVRIAGVTGDTGGTTPGLTKVVVVADESGRIHCLDATGNTDGTTWEYWSYPSTTTLNDPNLTSGIDGTYNASLGADNVPVATMPQGFDLSSAAVARVQTGVTAGSPVYSYYLYVGASNGRVYCIDMAGRGDFNRTTRTIGTTQRLWTYPDDYKPNQPTAPIADSDLGGFRGSIVFGDANTGAGDTQTVYVPAYQGRVYALNALGDTNSRTTTVRWRYPEADQAPLPNIVMTPTLFRLSTTTGPNTGAGRLYFGTQRSSLDDTAGRFYCLDAASGDIVWQYNGGAQNTNDPHDTASTLRYDATEVFSAGNGYDTANTVVNQFGSFGTGTVAVPASLLDGNKSAATPTAPTHVDEVYALNSNRFLYAFNAANGTPITFSDTVGVHRYATNDLDVLSDANLTFTFTSAYNRNSTLVGGLPTGLELFPTIIVPSNDGRMREAFARAEDYNVFSDGSVSSYVADGVNFPAALNSAAASNNSTYLTDAMGSLYALDDKGSLGNNLIPGLYYGVNSVVPPNDPRGAIFRNLKIRLVNRKAYNLLRNVDDQGRGGLTWYQVNDPSDPAFPGYQGPTSTAGNPYAFEWGETAYVMVYDFPYADTALDANGKPTNVPAPTVTLTLSVDGKTVRQQQIDSRKYFEPRNAPDVDGSPTDATGAVMRKNGYAIYPFTFNSAGSTALPPGAGKITATISTSSIGSGGQATEVLNDTRPSTSATNGSAINFKMANPLAIEVRDEPAPDNTYRSMGLTTLASDPTNLVNGSPNIGNTLYSQFLASAGYANHGGSATAQFNVYDRSLMVLVRPEGLNNVRLQRSNLERQGAQVGIIRPLVSTLYPNFEDSVATAYRPNRSLDYPNIGREQVRSAKDPNGNAENPLLTAVTLTPPTSIAGGLVTEDTLAAESTPDAPNNRRIRATPFELTVDVPRYQPPVNMGAMSPRNAGSAQDDPTDLLHLRHTSTLLTDKNGKPRYLPQGYFGRVQVFVDSNNDLSRNEGTTSEAYRSFNYSVAVQPQASLLTGTPNVDLGSLAAGTGYDTLNPASALGRNTRGKFNPWVGEWRDAYRPIVVRNDGNVNMLDLRIAKAKNESNGSISTANNEIWGIYSDDNDPAAWLSAALLDNGRNLQPGSLWSNIDTTFAPTNRFGGGNLVILQKPRVTDRTPTELLVNPFPRANPNLPGADGTNTGRINTDIGVDLKSPTAPNVGISVPIGFPVGNYSAEVRVFENLNGDDQILNLLNGGYEPYSDPITLTFKVRETRMTNRATPKTAPVIDDPASFGAANSIYDPNLGQAGDDRKRFRNAAPAALRMGNGALVVAWESDRQAKALDNGVPLAEYPSLIHFAGMGMTGNVNMSPMGTGAPAGNSPLYDLTQFQPAETNDRWFTPGNGNVGYPANPLALFPEGAAIPATIRFNSPAFPQSGTFATPYMGFVGNAQVTTDTGRLSLSRVFVTPISVNGPNVTPGAAIPVPGDPQTAKGKPSVLQLGPNSGLVFYSETSAGQSGISVSRFTGGAFPPNVAPVPLGFGDGFSSVFSPSVTARQYQRNGQPLVEMSFAGKLRGRPNAEVYLSRLRLGAGTLVDGNGTNVEAPRSGSPFVPMLQQENERLLSEGGGVYRARGVLWIRQNPIALEQFVDGVSTGTVFATNPETNRVDPPAVERQSGLLVYTSRLGGKVYLDPELGTVRFVGAAPGRNVELRLTYTPTFLRVTPGGAAGYSAVNGMWDARPVSETATVGNVTYFPYWFMPNGNPVTMGNGNPSNDRYLFVYGRGAAGGGVTARPFSTSMRLGVRLPTRIATNQDGSVVGISVTGNTMPYQVDPANGRVYFMAEDEGKQVKITYKGVRESTNAQVDVPTVTAFVSLVLEKSEAPVAVDEAANDSEVTAFLDPFPIPGRPPLVWMFYTSTRAGGPDVYFQTIAPRFLPSAK